MSKRNIKQPAGFDQENITGFFMLSCKSTAIAISNKLTGSQLRLWLFLSRNQPFADRTIKREKIFRPLPSPQEIGSKLGVSAETVQKDMRLLRKLELYDYQSLTWQGFNQSADEAKKESQRIKKAKSQKSQKKKLSKGLNKPPKRLNNSSKGLNNPSERLNSPSGKAEAPVNKSTEVTSQTYSDFIRSLPEEERENFIHFVKEQTSNFQNKINDLEAWLASKNSADENRWKVYYKNYQASKLNESRGIDDQGLAGLSSSETKKAIAKFQQQLKRQKTVSGKIENEQPLEVTLGGVS